MQGCPADSQRKVAARLERTARNRLTNGFLCAGEAEPCTKLAA